MFHRLPSSDYDAGARRVLPTPGQLARTTVKAAPFLDSGSERDATGGASTVSDA
jgi:hypothetical protein